MDKLSPLGPVYQAGTLSGNPVAMAAGLATLKVLKRTNPWRSLDERTAGFLAPFKSEADRLKIPVQVNRLGSMFTVFFSDEPVTDLETARRSDTKLYARFFHALLEEGVYFPPSQFEAAFVSASHRTRVLEEASDAMIRALRAL